MKRRKNTENGQAIVVIAFAFIILVAFAGLAIDGGMVYSDRRHAQNASDAGSLAGGGAAALELANSNQKFLFEDFNCGSSTVNTAIADAETAAVNFMLANGYSAADFTVSTQCVDEDSSYFQEKYIDINTQIITDTQTSLIHVVYDGPVQNRVTATTRVKPRMPLAYGNAVVGLNPATNCDDASVDGVKIGGTGGVQIKGGGIFSNGCLTGQGTCEVEITEIEEQDFVGIGYAGGIFDACPTMIPAPQSITETLPEDSYIVEPPDCTHPDAVNIDNITLSGHQTLDLNTAYPDKHLVCLGSSGNAIKMTGGEFSGDGFTIYLKNSGDIEISGGVVDLSAPSAVPKPDPGLPGILFYVNPENTSVIDINGNVESKYYGVIYAPFADVTVTGSGDIGPTFNTQIIGWNVSVLGTANIDIWYDDTWNSTRPTLVNLQK